ncbi:MAG TPA: ribulokinase [Puia sp.]|nr:ribulokinase [Puia sp.]
MKNEAFVIGIDYGTDSVRAVIIDSKNGAEISSSLFYYPRWKDGLYCNPSLNQFRQHPKDYIEGLEQTITSCLKKAGPEAAANIRAISIDTTGSTPVAVDKTGTPLSLLPGFENNPNAMFVLWKDHTAVNEATAINEHAKKFDTNYLQFVGGIYSSEWFWAKLLHILKEDENVRQRCYSWVEHCDWIPFVLTGGRNISAMRRGVCSAGHKALWAEEFGGLPPDNFFSSLSPLLKGFPDRLFQKTYTADQAAGYLSKEWAEKLGVSVDVVVGVGAFDAHMGAVGGQIEPYHLSKVMGTSTCDMLVAPVNDVKGKLVKGICGQVPGSIIPGMMGMEAGQSAFGDAYAWFRNILTWPFQNMLSQSSLINSDTAKSLSEEMMSSMIPSLSGAAAKLPLESDAELALDWLNGRRTPDANQLLEGAITGLNLGTDAPGIFKSIAEATCFGAKAIVECFNQEGIEVKGLIGLGGVAKKSPFIMQMMADVMNMPLRIHRSEQTCAFGAAMFAATAAGIYKKVEDAMNAMGQGFDTTYHPRKSNVDIYTKRYSRYKELGHFIEHHFTTKPGS